MALYSDLNAVQPTVAPKAIDLESIYQSLYNILMTTPGERLFEEEFGLDFEDQLFEIIDDISALEVFRLVVEAVERWEGRVVVDKGATKVVADPDNYSFTLNLYFSVRGLSNETFTLTGSFTH